MDSQLRERIARLSDQELLEIVERKTMDYRREAIDVAIAELDARSITFVRAANVTTDETGSIQEPAPLISQPGVAAAPCYE